MPLSRHLSELRKIEAAHRFTNFGPLNDEFETRLVRDLFGGRGTCTTVANATLGLMLSIRAVLLRSYSKSERDNRDLVIVPSFTFPATAHAVLWNGLSIVFCDIEPETWLPSHQSIEDIMKRYGPRVAAVMPYATFGNNLDLRWYQDFQKRTGVPVVVDAAASLGSLLPDGKHFGAGSRLPLVFSMHATKLFATTEGGVVYAADRDLIADIRAMSNFGFDKDRNVVLPGLNAKVPEFVALQALLKLRELHAIIRKRKKLVERYRKRLPGVTFQQTNGDPSFWFVPACLPVSRESRDQIIASAHRGGVELRKYFSPALHEQPFFSGALHLDLATTESVSASIISLPLYNSMTVDDVDAITDVITAGSAQRQRTKARS